MLLLRCVKGLFCVTGFSIWVHQQHQNWALTDKKFTDEKEGKKMSTSPKLFAKKLKKVSDMSVKCLQKLYTSLAFCTFISPHGTNMYPLGGTKTFPTDDKGYSRCIFEQGHNHWKGQVLHSNQIWPNCLSQCLIFLMFLWCISLLTALFVIRMTKHFKCSKLVCLNSIQCQNYWEGQ